MELQKPGQRRHPDVDGGWAWVILVSSFMCLFFTCGALYSVGVFNVIFLENFKESTALTSLVGSLLIGLIALMDPYGVGKQPTALLTPRTYDGPVSSIMCNWLGWRITTMIGGLIATIGTFLASYSQSLMQILIFYGVISGIGHGLAYTPAIVVVGYYFEKYRTVASGIASVGAGVGMMTFPPLIQFFMEYYSWREIMVYMSCFYAQICVFGALMIPLPLNDLDYTMEVKSEACEGKQPEETTNTTVTTVIANNNATTNGTCQNGEAIVNGKSPQPDVHCCFDKTQKPDHKPAPVMLSSSGLNAAHSLMYLNDINKNREATLKLSTHSIYEKLSTCDHHYDTNNDNSGDMTSGSVDSLDTNGNALKYKTSCSCSNIGLYFGTCCGYSCSCSKSGSLHFVFTGKFMIFCASIFMFGIGLSALYLHLSAFAITSGASETEASFLITLLGISSIISRVFTGVAGNDNSIDNTILYIGAFGIAGISTMICPSFGTSSKGRMVYALFFGFYGSCFNVLLAPLTVEIIGLKNLSMAFGIEMVVNGVAYFIGPPIAGWLFDVTKSYNTSFFLAGICLICSAVIMMLVSVFQSPTLPTRLMDVKKEHIRTPELEKFSVPS